MGLTFRLSKKNFRMLGNGIMGMEVLARLHSHDIDIYAKTGVFCPEHYTDHNGNVRITWLEGKVIIPRVGVKDMDIREVLTTARDRLAEIERTVTDAYSEMLASREKPWKEWLQETIDGRKKDEKKTTSLIECLERYIATGLKVTEPTKRHYLVLVGILERFETQKKKKLTLDGLTPEDIGKIADYIKEGEMEEVEVDGEKKKEVKHRSQNYVIDMIKKLRTFYNWANGMSKKNRIEPLTTNDPFRYYTIGTAQYGTPFYLTVEERNKLYETTMPTEHLARQRDIFIFHCMIGCRISDLCAMTKDNVIDGAIEYIPRKTKEGRPYVVRVPLNRQAKEILERYNDCGHRLLPFVAQQQYNEDIKAMLTVAGITRIVTVLNPKTRMEEKRPINEVATSHMARRTFIGNIYKKVKDPNLVGKLSGHKEGSKAFARYRDIDDDMAKELVAMLE